MHKRLIMACMAITAFAAFVVAPAASASPVLTHPTGTAYCPNGGTGSTCLVTGTNIGNWEFMNGLGTFVCNSVTMTGNVTTNKENHIQIDITEAHFTGTGAGGDCTSPIGDFKLTTTVGNGVPYCLTAGGLLGADKFTARGNSCDKAQRSITFVLDFTNGPTCYYDRTTVVEGTFQTDTEASKDAVFSFSGAEWVKEKGENETFLKPCVASYKMSGSWTLETDKAGANEPMFIS